MIARVAHHPPTGPCLSPTAHHCHSMCGFHMDMSVCGMWLRIALADTPQINILGESVARVAPRFGGVCAGFVPGCLLLASGAPPE